jgi:hypothetical protein
MIGSEGTWEEILQYAPQLAGQRVKVTILPPSNSQKDVDSGAPANAVDPSATFIGVVSHGSLATDLDTELYGR